MHRARPPLHAAFVHFPIALLGTSLVFDGAALVLGAPLGWTIAFWNLALGLAISVVTATTGLVDSLRVAPEAAAATVVTRHMLVVLSALTCYGAALLVRGGAQVPTGSACLGTLALELGGLVLLLVGGWLGGELVYRHGVGHVPAPAPVTDRS